MYKKKLGMYIYSITYSIVACRYKSRLCSGLYISVVYMYVIVFVRCTHAAFQMHAWLIAATAQMLDRCLCMTIVCRPKNSLA
jgi:hypothetical protein